MLNLERRFEAIDRNPSNLDTVGEFVTDLSHEIIQIEDGYKFFVALTAMLLGENILQNILEDDYISKEAVPDIDTSIRQYAELFALLHNKKSFVENASIFGTLYRKLLKNKQHLPIKVGKALHYYEGSNENSILIKKSTDKDGKFFDADLIFSKVLLSKKFMSSYISMVGKAVKKYNATKLCFIEKRKGPIGTLLMLSEFVNTIGIPAFIYRAGYIDNIGRIKGYPPDQNDRIGIIYDAAFSGGGLAEVIRYLESCYDSKVDFAAVITNYNSVACTKLLSELNVELITFINVSDLEKFEFDDTDINTDAQNISEQFVFFKEEVYFKLRNPAQDAKLMETLFKRKIPHASYPQDIFGTSYEDKKKLEQLGFEFENASIINASSLSLEERNALKEKCRKNWLLNRDQAINELLAKYGVDKE